jgi:hypothetical protein
VSGRRGKGEGAREGAITEVDLLYIIYIIYSIYV